MTLSRFFKTPKGLLLVVLSGLTAVAAYHEGYRRVAPGLASAIVVAMLIDAPILRARRRRWVFPDGALLTALIVAMILSPHEPWYVTAATSAIGVLSKYAFRVRTANIFNPAALALVATFYMFDTAQNWWGALPDLSPAVLIGVIAVGVFITRRVNRVPAALTFLGVYYLLAALRAFTGDPARVAELYRTPDLHAALFFAFFMVTDPPTSPPHPRDQVVFGVVVAVAGYATFEFIGAVYFLLAGLLAANVWEAARRGRSRRAGARVQAIA